MIEGYESHREIEKGKTYALLNARSGDKVYPLMIGEVRPIRSKNWCIIDSSVPKKDVDGTVIDSADSIISLPQLGQLLKPHETLYTKKSGWPRLEPAALK